MSAFRDRVSNYVHDHADFSMAVLALIILALCVVLWLWARKVRRLERECEELRSAARRQALAAPADRALAEAAAARSLRSASAAATAKAAVDRSPRVGYSVADKADSAKAGAADAAEARTEVAEPPAGDRVEPAPAAGAAVAAAGGAIAVPAPAATAAVGDQPGANSSPWRADAAGATRVPAEDSAAWAAPAAPLTQATPDKPAALAAAATVGERRVPGLREQPAPWKETSLVTPPPAPPAEEVSGWAAAATIPAAPPAGQLVRAAPPAEPEAPGPAEPPALGSSPATEPAARDGAPDGDVESHQAYDAWDAVVGEGLADADPARPREPSTDGGPPGLELTTPDAAAPGLNGAEHPLGEILPEPPATEAIVTTPPPRSPGSTPQPWAPPAGQVEAPAVPSETAPSDAAPAPETATEPALEQSSDVSGETSRDLPDWYRPPGSVDAGAAPGPGEDLLLVEDDENVSTAYRLLLEARGYTVRTVCDGVAGLEAARLRRPDLILLDVMMPRMNGIVFLKALRGEDALASVPVVILSNFKEQRLVERALALGAIEYVVKAQTGPEALLDAIPHWLRGAKAG